jgi:hypothetical protein
MYAPQRRPVVLVLNPLDSLGEDQVRFRLAQFRMKIKKIDQVAGLCRFEKRQEQTSRQSALEK